MGKRKFIRAQSKHGASFGPRKSLFSLVHHVKQRNSQSYASMKRSAPSLSTVRKVLATLFFAVSIMSAATPVFTGNTTNPTKKPPACKVCHHKGKPDQQKSNGTGWKPQAAAGTTGP